MGHRLALDHPSGDLVVLGDEHIQSVLDGSQAAKRKRMILPLHRGLDDPLHRMLNAIQPGSYVRPHRHLDPPKAEAWLALRGRLLFVSFFDDGAIDQGLVIGASGGAFGIDLVPGRYHTICALEPDTVIYEVKTGPYEKSTDKAFAPWAPKEGSAAAPVYLQRLLDQTREIWQPVQASG